MKPYTKEVARRKCQGCGEKMLGAFVKGLVGDDGMLKSAVLIIRECPNCTFPGSEEKLNASEIEKINNVAASTEALKPSDIYYTKETRTGEDGKIWIQIKWRGRWDIEDIKEMTGKIMRAMNYPEMEGGTATDEDMGAVFSKLKSCWYIRKDRLEKFEETIMEYADRMVPFDQVSDEMIKGLDEMFSAK